MAGTITSLQVQKHNRDRVNIYVDGVFAVGTAVILAAGLKVGQYLSDADLARLKDRDNVEQAHEAALNLLSYRPRSESEIRRALQKRDVPDEVVDVVVERLTSAGLLNDLEFARYWIENRSQFRPRGLRALQYELREKGISEAVAAQALAQVNEQTAARKVAADAMHRFRRTPPADLRRKVITYMARRGFSYETIAPLVEEMLEMGSVQRENLADIESEEKDNG